MLKSSGSRNSHKAMEVIKSAGAVSSDVLTAASFTPFGGVSFGDWYRNNPVAHEQHHAMHVFTFLYIAIRKTLSGERVKRRLVGRILHHLMDLREFIDNKDLNVLVNDLCGSLQREYERSLSFAARLVCKPVFGIRMRLSGRWRNGIVSSFTGFVILCSEHEQEAHICMFPWLMKNQEKILKLAEHYKQSAAFLGFLPIRKPEFGKARLSNSNEKVAK